MKRIGRISALFAAALALPAAAAGQDTRTPAGEFRDGHAVDTIIAANQKSTSELRRDFWRAERDFYAIYNKLNEDSLYDVRCTREAPTGSVIKVQTCRPKFIDRAIREGKVSRGTNLESSPELADKIATFRKKLDNLVAVNPDLQAAADALRSAHASLAADQERRSRN